MLPTNCLMLRMNKPRFRFSVRFLLIWVVPYVALAAAIIAWPFGFAAEMLNTNARQIAFMVLTSLWCAAWAAKDSC
jgi:hypothetical protein